MTANPKPTEALHTDGLLAGTRKPQMTDEIKYLLADLKSAYETETPALSERTREMIRGAYIALVGYVSLPPAEALPSMERIRYVLMKHGENQIGCDCDWRATPNEKGIIFWHKAWVEHILAKLKVTR